MGTREAHRRTRRTARGPAALLAASVLAAACSGGDDGGTTREGTGEPGIPSATSSTTVAYAGYRSDLYADPTKWLCRPDLSRDTCREDLDVTIVEADGDVATVPHEVADAPPADCFYVYPTVNFGEPGNASIDGEPSPLELGAAHGQAGPLSSVCRVFAPRYRQVILGSGGAGDAELAYGDVLDAFRHYIANDNGGRGVVLVGHSQGASHLSRLVREEFDDEPDMRARLVSALLIGSGVRVLPGEDAGGDFANVPACRAPDQTACVVSYASFRSTSPPPPNAFFGRPREGEGEVLCTNPAALDGGSAPLDLRFPHTASAFAPGVDAPAVEAGLIAMPGLLAGECVHRDGFTYLEITVQGDPDDPRTDDIGGDLTPEWGLHAVDVQLALGDLVELVAAQIEAWERG